MNPATKRFLGTARKIFRWLRITLWFILLLFICAAVYFNTIGLPNFIKRPLLAKIREQGWEVQFTNMRWPWYRQITIEHAFFSRADKTGPTFSAARAELNVHWSQKAGFQIRSLNIDSGELRWPQTNRSPGRLDKIKTRFVFHRDGRLELAPIQARFRGAKINISGVLTNAGALRETSFPTATTKATQLDLTPLLDQVEKIDWGLSDINISFRGDARELSKIRTELSFVSRRLETPFGQSGGFELHALFKHSSNTPSLTLNVSADTLETEWFSGENIGGTVHAIAIDDSFALWNTETKIAAEDFHARFGTNSVRAITAQLVAQMTNSLEKLQPLNASGKLTLAESMVHLAQPTPVDAVINDGEVAFTYEKGSQKTNTSLGIWENLRPFVLQISTGSGDLKVPELQATNFQCVAHWKFPELTWKQMDIRSDAGSVTTEGALDVETRLIHGRISSDFDLKKFQPRLPRSAQRFLSQFEWEVPPTLHGEVSATLPAWDNKTPDWRDEVLPTVKIDGHISSKGPSFRKVTALSATTDVHYSNMVWRFPNMRIVRPEGEARVGLTTDDRTFNFQFVVDSEFDPKIIRSQVPPQTQQLLDDFHFATAPRFRGEIRGQWNAPAKTGVKGEASASNVTFRGTVIEKVNGSIEFTNKLLVISNAHLEQNGGRMDAPEISIDFGKGKFSFHRLDSTVDPILVARTLKISQAEFLEPYRFAKPPRVMLEGSFTLNRVEDADMHFLVSGNDFQWRRFKLEKLSTELHWVGNSLKLTNANASGFAPGQMSGWAFLNFLPHEKINYQFSISAGNVDMRLLARALQLTNKVEGALSGYFFVNSGDMSGLESWQGAGHFELRDGLIWELPMFGIFSPIIDTMLPGLGKSRARDATGDLVVNNGVFTSENLEIRASTFRMQYRGSIDAPQQRIAARVNAEILRDTWGVGPVVSLVLTPLSKLFEYEVRGPLKNPTVEPVYVPKFLMMTLRPFHTMKKALTNEGQSERPAEKETTNP